MPAGDLEFPVQLWRLSLFPPSYALESDLSHSISLSLNCLCVPCPLMEASSHGREGNLINCMSTNRITSSLTYRESGLKLITHAWRKGRMRQSKEGENRGGQNRARASPGQKGLPSPERSICEYVCVYASCTVLYMCMLCLLHTHYSPVCAWNTPGWSADRGLWVFTFRSSSYGSEIDNRKWIYYFLLVECV